MKTVAFVAYPGLTPLDLVGPLQVLSALAEFHPDFEVAVVAQDTGPLPTDTPLALTASHTFEQVPDPYAIIVPGGREPTFRALTDQALLGYLRSTSPAVVASVCTGSLVLGAAGLLKGRAATTHWAFLNLLTEFDATPVSRRWVEDGPVLTAAGVSAGIDMGLHLTARLAGENVARAVQFGIEYDPEPPMGPLDWTTAPRDLWIGLATATVRDGLTDAPELGARLAARL